MNFFLYLLSLNLRGARLTSLHIHGLSLGLIVRGRPFNLKGGGGGYGFLFRSELFFRTTQELDFFLSRKGYMTKTLNQIFFFSSTKIRIFFSATLGIRIFF